MRVKRGDIIAYVGSTGNADPRRPHLHFAVFELGPKREWWKGKPIDPYTSLVEALRNSQ
jgi:murein DD-endopeptidase MepM/ murein hydrolase activator NlpD